jgi:hypothetical protein
VSPIINKTYAQPSTTINYAPNISQQINVNISTSGYGIRKDSPVDNFNNVDKIAKMNPIVTSTPVITRTVDKSSAFNYASNTNEYEYIRKLKLAT